MKNLKKLASLVLSVMMILSLTIAVADDEAETGTITINSANADNTYAIYQLMDLESYDTTTGNYSYKVMDEWMDFFTSDQAKTYIQVDTNGYVGKWLAGDGNTSDPANFAKSALAYAEHNDIDPVVSETPTEAGALKFEGLDLGYYLIDSTMGALCGLTTTNPNAYVNAKNGQPSIDKQVQEDQTDNWGKENSADIGQVVNFRTTINVQPGAQNYVLHDSMSEAIDFDKDSIVAYHVVSGSTDHTGTVVDQETYYTVVTEGLADGCTFEVRFNEEFCEHIGTNDRVVVLYSGTLNKKAIIAQTGNANESWLEFGDKHFTTKSSTQTYTYAFDLVKTDSANKLLDGASFLIYDAATAGNVVPVVKVGDNAYRRAKTGEEGEEGKGVEIEVTGGQVRVSGFDNGTYYLEETVNPDGYNKLSARHKFEIANGNLDAIITEGVVSTGSGVHVVNKTGTILPETGGMGTTLFYIIGGVLVAAAVVVLITKKRMQNVD